MLDSVRARLTLWYVGVLALVLVIFSIGVYGLFAAILYDRLDSELGATLEAAALTLAREAGMGVPEKMAAESALATHVVLRIEAGAVFDESGKPITEKIASSGVHAALPDADLIPPSEAELYTVPDALSTDGRRLAVRRIVVPSTGKTYILVITRPLDLVERDLRVIRLILFLAVPGAVLMAGVGGWFLARRSLAPVVAMTERAHRISAENLEQRLPISNPKDELGRLAATFNELLARLDSSFEQQRRFMADASHELRTPLSVMRTSSDVTLEREHRHESEYRDALKVIDEQTRRLTRIVEDMFTLARADAGRRILNPSDFYLDELLEEAARAAGVLAAPKGIKIDVESFPETPYRGDEGLLRQMVLNLLDNALKYTPAGGHVGVRLDREGETLAIVISDSGPGIPADAQMQIFERFYRVDKSRSRESASDSSSGAGLGLSIARWIADAHDGTLDLVRSDSRGSTFAAYLPSNPVLNGDPEPA